MKEYFKKLEKKDRIVILFFIAILLVSIFLRTYHFSDWLRFNADQSRDASLTINALKNKELPLLGPRAGGTEFKLGPVFYYFQITAMKLFGSEPYVAAYPDLLFSVLSIPLFFGLARIFFGLRISLGMTWLLAISYFMVGYSRFAWNPNSTPFFVMLYLYSFYGLIKTEGSKKMVWATVAGIALGINAQLHTSLLIILPVLTALILAVLFKKKKIRVGAIMIILAVALLMNVPQIISEINSRGKNTMQFILGATEKNGRNSSLRKNVLIDLSCHIKANGHILTSLGDGDDCDYDSEIRTFKKLDGRRMTLVEKVTFVARVIVFVLFSLGGYFLLQRSARKEEDGNKKIMLFIFSAYVGISFLLFVAWATELSVRFFLGLSFVPFLLMGFWLSFLSKKFKKETIFILIAVLALSFLNLRKIYDVYKDLEYGGGEINNNFEYATLEEEKFIVEFINDNSEGENVLYLDAQAGYLFKMLRPLQFLAKKYDLALVELNKEIKLEKGSRLFYVKSADNRCELAEKILEKYEIEKCVLYRQFSIFALKVK